MIRTADAPAQIALSIDGRALSEDGKDIVQVRVTALDERGVFYPYGENRTFFKVIGPGKIRALDNGSPVDVEKHFEAENRIAMDEGFVWDSMPVAANPGGEQAEDAALSGAKVISKGRGFHGRGFIDFGHNVGGYAEWYQENDGDARMAELVIRYSGKRPGRPGRYIKLSVNGQVVKEKLLLPNTENWGSDWKTVAVPITIGRGANTIRLTTVESGGMYIDEVLIK